MPQWTEVQDLEVDWTTRQKGSGYLIPAHTPLGTSGYTYIYMNVLVSHNSSGRVSSCMHAAPFDSAHTLRTLS